MNYRFRAPGRRAPDAVAGVCTVSLVVALLVCLAASPAASAPTPMVVPPVVTYAPPTDAPVADGFRPPTSPYGPGNRGWAYASTAGTPVLAAGDGHVVFAGAVGTGQHVTVLHADGLRTSYSFLETVAVRTGTTVRRSEMVGTATDHLHFGVRAPDGTYLDPALLFAPLQTRVDGALLLPDNEVAEHAQAFSASGPTPERPPPRDPWAGHQPAPDGSPTATVVAGWTHRAPACTALETPILIPGVPPSPRSPSTSPPGVPSSAAGRRILVLVGGLGSSSTQAGIEALPASTLGYAAADVVRFSYNGGRVPDSTDAADLAGVSATSYASLDTQRNVAASAAHLTQFLAALRAAAPGVPIDVVAHSLGGLVARSSLTSNPSGVTTLVTVGTPHGGAPLVDALAQAAPGPGRQRVADRIAEVAGTGFDLDQPVFVDLQAGSPLVRGLARTPVARNIRFVSVGATGDLVVPAGRTIVRGATNVLVEQGGLTAHDDLPGLSETARIVALNRDGMPPPCRSRVSASMGAITAAGIETAELALGLVLRPR